VHRSIETSSRPTTSHALVAVACGAITLVIAFWLSTWTSDHSVSGPGALMDVLVRSAPAAAAWLIGAFGFGAIVSRWLTSGVERPSWPIQMGLGVATLLTLDAALGATGFLQIGGSAGAMALTAVGVLLAVIEAIARQRATGAASPHHPDPPVPSRWQVILPLAWTPAMGVLVVAAASSPGWLWRSEFGGYDALSYHLQLPREWIDAGAIVPLEHNVYSFLPGYVEAAFYHLALLRGDAVEAAIAAQLLHASFAVFSAMAVSVLCRRTLSGDGVHDDGGNATGTLAGAALLGTPWIVVVGSLAYNELVVLFLLVVGLLAVHSPPPSAPGRTGLLAGVIAGGACGAKLTALGFVALPLAAFAACRCRNMSYVMRFGMAACAGGAAVLAPYMIRNLAATGQPVFPFMYALFGEAHWSESQFDAWQTGHWSDAGVLGRLQLLVDEWLRQGVGASPYSPLEPWVAQWTVLPSLGMIGLGVACLHARTRRIAFSLLVVLALQLVFWLAFTHLKSRFLVPTAVPLALGVALGAAAASSISTSSRVRVCAGCAAALIAAAFAIQPLWSYRSEGGGAPADRIGVTGIMTGAALPEDVVRDLARTMPTVYINRVLAPGSRVLLVGESTPFYMALDRVAYSTVWDRGPLSRAMDESDEPQRWVNHLRDRGFTHVLVDAAMLDNWSARGWGDTRLTSSRVVEALERHARLVQTFTESGSLRLYSLE
jgi:hypothetical protein